MTLSPQKHGPVPVTRQRSGVVTVEVAICIPVLFLFVFFSMEISRAYFLRHAVDNAAYEACRVIKVPGATHSEGMAVVDQIMDACGLTGYQVTISPNVIDETTDNVSVTVSIPFGENMSLTTAFFQGKVLTATSRLKTERYRN